MSEVEINLKEIFNGQLEDISSEKQSMSEHDIFTSWIVTNVLDLSDSDVDDAMDINKISDDFDILVIDDDEEIITLGKTFFKKELDYKISLGEFKNFITSCGEFEDNTLVTSNDKLKDKLSVYRQFRKRGYKVRMILAVSGELTPEAKELLKDPITRSFYVDGDEDFELFEMEKLFRYITSLPTPIISIQFEPGINLLTDRIGGEKSIMGIVNAEEIINVYSHGEERLFLDNPRQSLGLTATNKMILKTLDDEDGRRKFVKLNNGISAVCENFSEDDSSYDKYKFFNFKIVNGRQTTFSLNRAKQLGLLDKDPVKVMLRVHEATSEEDKEKISTATNTQNIIKPSDQVSIRTEIKMLVLKTQDEFPGWYFEGQRGAFQTFDKEKRNSITNRRKMEKAKTIRYYIAYSGKPWESIKQSENSIFITQYDEIFPIITPKEIIVPFIFNRILEELTTKWKKSNLHEDLNQLLKLRIVKSYCLAIINETLSSMDNDTQQKVEKALIEIVTKLKKTDELPDQLFRIAEASLRKLLMAVNFITKHPTMWESKELRDLLLSDKNLISKIFEKAKHNVETSGDNPLRDRLEDILS